jgi:putative ATP-dependent endonuclease of the OLD family
MDCSTMGSPRTTAFFSQRVILVEGPSERALYRYLTTRKKMAPPARDLSVIDCIGKYDIHRFVAILSAFGIDHSVLYDGDEGKSNDVAATKAIERAKTEFTKHAIRLDKDLEAKLGIPPVQGVTPQAAASPLSPGGTRS